MNRYEKENAINAIMGYYSAPFKPSDVESRFESAREEAIRNIESYIENIKNISIVDAFPKLKRKTTDDPITNS